MVCEPGAAVGAAPGIRTTADLPQIIPALRGSR